jgi:hypothetical protein
MVSPISNATPAQVIPQPAAARQPAPQAQPPQAAPADTVHISAAAALRQELTETSAQTTREANNGDLQAKRLLAREAADKTAGS